MLSCLNNSDVLTLSTSAIASILSIKEKWGRVDKGYLADLIFTEDNPLDNIDVLRNPEYVMKSGRLYSRIELERLRP